jgi:hypothetical protein
LLLETTLTLESTFPHRARTLSGAPSQFSARHWDTASLTDNRAWHNDAYWINERAKQQRYSFRMLRYWYMAELLLAERKRLGRPLAVLEVGVDRGQMKAFIDGIPSQDPGTPLYASWNAADVKPQQEALIAAGYAGCSTLNLDDASSLAKFSAAHTKKYDVVILLHVLEHLHHPERAVTFISATLQDGGIALGGRCCRRALHRSAKGSSSVPHNHLASSARFRHSGCGTWPKVRGWRVNTPPVPSRYGHPAHSSKTMRGGCGSMSPSAR